MKILSAIIVAACGIAILAGFACIAILLEKQSFNHCKCMRCNYPLRHFDNDSQGGRGYVCDKCGYITWVSWPSVDKEYREDK